MLSLRLRFLSACVSLAVRLGKGLYLCLCEEMTCLSLSHNFVILGFKIGGHHVGLLSNVFTSVLLLALLSSKKNCSCNVLSNLVTSCCNVCVFMLCVGTEKVRPLFKTVISLDVKM